MTKIKHLRLVVDNGKIIDVFKPLVNKQQKKIKELINIQTKMKHLKLDEVKLAKEITTIEEEINKLEGEIYGTIRYKPKISSGKDRSSARKDNE